jgi:hypothetical protein
MKQIIIKKCPLIKPLKYIIVNYIINSKDYNIIESKNAEHLVRNFYIQWKQNEGKEWIANADNSYERMIYRILAKQHGLKVKKQRVEIKNVWVCRWHGHILKLNQDSFIDGPGCDDDPFCLKCPAGRCDMEDWILTTTKVPKLFIRT